MNILITSGGTREPIDSVRSIANHATGRLGAKIADAFAAEESCHRVVCLCGSGSILPDNKKIEIVPIRGTLDLEETLRRLTSTDHFDAIVHSMAVSDYRVRTVTTVTELAKAALHSKPETMRETLSCVPGLDCSGKISSTVEDLTLFLERTPKIISFLRDMAPDAVLVGFKLLDGVPHEELMAVARNLMEQNDCDYVLANDMVTVSGSQHIGYLLDRDGQELCCDGKDAIAAAIVEAVLRGAKRV